MLLGDLTSFIERFSPLLSFLGGGVGVKLVDKLMSGRAQEFSESSQIRKELRQQVELLRIEIDEWKSEADDWRNKYWELTSKHVALEGDFQSLKLDFETFKRHLNSPPENQV